MAAEEARHQKLAPGAGKIALGPLPPPARHGAPEGEEAPGILNRLVDRQSGAERRQHESR